MNKQDYQDQLDTIRQQLNDGRKRTIEQLRKEDPDVIKANILHAERSNRLGANYQMALNLLPRGEIQPEEFIRQQEAIDAKRDSVENEKIQPGLSTAREKMLMNAFHDNEDLLAKARNDLENDPSLQWLNNPEQERTVNNDEISEKAHTRFEVQNAPNASSRFDDVAEVDYHESHSNFNRSAGVNEPEYLKGYPDTPPLERKSPKKDDYDSLRNYSGKKEYPGFDDYGLSDPSSEPCKDGPQIDIGDKD